MAVAVLIPVQIPTPNDQNELDIDEFDVEAEEDEWEEEVDEEHVCWRYLWRGDSSSISVAQLPFVMVVFILWFLCFGFCGCFWG